MNIGSALEITANTIQQLMSLVFLYLFFDKPNGKTKRLLPFLSAALLLLAVTMVGTVNALTSNYLYYLITAVITILYTTVFLRGKLYLRIIIPIAVSNISIAYLTVSVMSSSGALQFVQGVALPQSLRYPVLFVADIIYAAFLFIIYRFGKGKINMRSKSDILAFIVIPLITCTVGLTALMLLKSVDFDGTVQIYVTVIALCTAVMVMIFWYLMIKSGKEAQIKTDLMLSRQREELYKSSVLSTHEQIEKISVIKHDMKSKIMSIGMLISQGEYDRAKALCNSAGESLSTTYTPVNTDNPTLNAIMNVELEKAQSNEINCTYEIADTLKNMRDADIISLIANLCDNAIEYLAHIPQEQRQMSITISSYKSYCRVVCKNAVASSVLAENPELNTTKDDKTLHGKGMNILRELAKKFGGELLINEDGNQLTVSVMMMK
ncbi:GHKL domain-containing protein [Ruminococcaceae bacterium P7]|nr:GHKL domain-containing protein [Ruminococcaceae bacterium P7]